MSFHSWLRNLRSTPAPRRDQPHRGRKGSKRVATHRLAFEPLDDRSVPAFLAPVDYSVGFGSHDLKAGDFNGDHIPDLAALNGSAVSVLLGNGDGTFQPARDTLAAWQPLSLAVGDFNEDGKLDVATNNYYMPGQDGVTVLLGNGDGTFTHAPSVEGLEWADAIATGDLNADGTLDLVTTSLNFSISYGYFTYVSVMIGHGDGTFNSDYETYEGDFSTPLALADIDGDGDDDVVVGSKVFLSNGDGTLQGPRDFDTGTDLWSPPRADFNADGNPDQVYLGQDSLGVGLGDGDGNFAPPIWTPVGSLPSYLAVADFNADGRPDAAVITRYPDKVTVLLNDGSWSPGDPPSVSIRDASVTEGNTGTVNATFAVTLSHTSAADVTVHFETADGTAAAGSDYTAAAGDVTIPAGQTRATVTVAVRGDRLAEPTETFAVNLTDATGATVGDGQATGTILDDEPRISIDDVTKAEGRRNKKTLFTFTVRLSAPYDQPVTVSFQTGNGTATTGDGDYVAKAGTLTFLPGETTKTITITVKGDSKREANETFFVDLTGLGTNVWPAKTRGIGTILNDD